MRVIGRDGVPLKDFLAWDGRDLCVVDPDLRHRTERSHLSPSTASSMELCPARWALERHGKQTDDPFSPSALGTAAHTVLEHLFELPPAERTQEQAMEILLGEAPQQVGSKPAAVRAQWVSEVHSAFKGVWEIEEPSEAEVLHREWEFECEVRGIPMKGVVDRIDQVDGGLRIIDYKSSKRLGKGDDHGHQLRIYRAAAEDALGQPVVEAWVYYIRLGKAKKVALSGPYQKSTEKHLASTWSEFSGYAEKGAFPAQTNFFCGFCSAVLGCPVAADAGRKPSPKAEDPVPLGIPTRRPFSSPVHLDPWDEVPEPETKNMEPAADPGHLIGDKEKPTTAEANKMRTELQPWEAATKDGQLNLNSHSAQAGAAMATWAYETVNKMAKAEGLELPPLHLVRPLTGLFARVVAKTQAKNDLRISMQDGSHKRIRGYFFTFTESNPLPWGGDQADWDAWESRAVAVCNSLLSATYWLWNADVKEISTEALAAATETIQAA